MVYWLLFFDNYLLGVYNSWYRYLLKYNVISNKFNKFIVQIVRKLRLVRIYIYLTNMVDSLTLKLREDIQPYIFFANDQINDVSVYIMYKINFKWNWIDNEYWNSIVL